MPSLDDSEQLPFRKAGKCGHAYFVPHFTTSGYSGNVIEVELHTDALGSVRLHGVVTDFADFYAAGGVGPYTGQVLLLYMAMEHTKMLIPRVGFPVGDQDFIVCLPQPTSTF